MAELHEALTRLAADATWPPTPELAARVRTAIETQPAPRRGVRGRRRPRHAGRCWRRWPRCSSVAASSRPPASARGCSSASACATRR